MTPRPTSLRMPVALSVFLAAAAVAVAAKTDPPAPAKSDAAATAKPAPKTEAKTEAKFETKPAAKTEAKAAAKTEPKTAAKTTAKTTTKAAEKPVSKLDVVAPSADQTLQGTVTVQVKVAPVDPSRLPTVAFAGLGGPPWVPLKRVENTMIWSGQIDSTLVPNGPQNLIVIATVPKERRATVQLRCVLKNPLHCYFGDLHGHTYYSDGTLFPADAYAYARDVAKLDFFSLTDHLELLDDAEWRDIRLQSEKANQDGKFVTLPGLEWTKAEGHVCIFDPGTRRWPTKSPKMYQAAVDADVVVKFNHPADGTKVFNGLAYSEVGDKAVQLLEVRSAVEEKAYLRALKLGWHLAPDASTDAHSPNWGNAGRCTGILAPGLSQRNVLAALKSRHCYSTLDHNCRLSFTVNGAVMGDVVAEPCTDVRVEVSVEDPDPKDATAKIELFEDGAVVKTDEPKTPSRQWKTTCSPPPGGHYYFVKATQADGNVLWSAPVWVTVAGK